MITNDPLQTETNSSSTNCSARSKKLPPPPLCLPAPKEDEQHVLNPNQKREQTKSTNNCCLSSSAEDCPHKSIPYTLPISQRPQILDILVSSSSSLLAPLPSDSKHKKPNNAVYLNRMNLIKQHQSPSKMTLNDTEWIDFMRLIIRKPFERELKALLDNYKLTYFDRVNSPNTSDDTIRSSLCAMVSEALATYSSDSSRPTQTGGELATTISSPIQPTSVTTNGSTKRKRQNVGNNSFTATPISINSQTKFVISHIVPGKYDNHNNGNKMTNQQQQQKQFQKKYTHLFKYIPTTEEQEYLSLQGHLKNISNSSRSFNSDNNNICLMLYDEVINYMDEYDVELSGISIENSFQLPESIIAHINLSI